MTDKMAELAAKTLGKTWEKVNEQERRVLQAVAQRLRVSRHINRELEASTTFGQRLADRVAALGGSWSFIIVFFVCLVGWMVLNSVILATRAFDPYPYILLNLVLSCLASIQAPVILMSQNRQGLKDREHAEHDYEVNLKAEIEIMQLHEKIEMLREREMARMLELLESQTLLLKTLQKRDGRAS